jgi:chaperonin GroEL
LTEALIKAGNIHITPDMNTTEVIRHINKISEYILSVLKKQAVEVDDKTLVEVASISANNDAEIGEIISKAYEKVGKHGIVTVEKSMTSETYAEVTNGIKVDRGYTSNLFINDQRKDECILEDVKVLVCDTEISNILQIETVLNQSFNKTKSYLSLDNVLKM